MTPQEVKEQLCGEYDKLRNSPVSYGIMQSRCEDAVYHCGGHWKDYVPPMMRADFPLDFGVRKSAVTSLSYSREELPVECPECDCLLTRGQILSRDTYTETALYPCPVCYKTFKVMITED